MARYKLILAYDGTSFAGSQRQVGRRTVQGELEGALRGLGWSGRSVTLAGRTDTGVHAAGQTAAVDLDWPHGCERLRSALNAHLAADLSVVQVELAAADFHPRYGARSRLYRYTLFCAEVRDPLRERFAWRVWPPLEHARLTEAAGLFAGQHDFAAFGSPPGRESSTIRTVLHSAWSGGKADLSYEVRADAFLYRMVRRMTFIQVAIAQGRCSQEAAARALDRPQLKTEMPAGLAPPQGLSLVEVTY